MITADDIDVVWRNVIVPGLLREGVEAHLAVIDPTEFIRPTKEAMVTALINHADRLRDTHSVSRGSTVGIGASQVGSDTLTGAIPRHSSINHATRRPDAT